MSDYQVPERAEMTFIATQYGTGEVREALGEGCRVAVAEELRAQADDLESRTMGSHLINSLISRFRERAGYLDPEGATR